MQKLSAIKNVLIVAVVSIPLVGMMIKNLTRSWRDGETAAATAETNSDNRSLVEQTRQRADAESIALMKLSEVELFSDRPIPELQVPGIDPALGKKVSKSRESLDRLVKVYSKGLRQITSQKELEALEPLAESAIWDDLLEAHPLREWVEQRIELLKRQIFNQELFAETEKAYNGKKYAECLRILKQIDEVGLSELQQKQIKDWKHKAEFDLYWTPKISKGELSQRIADLKAQLEKSPQPYSEDSRALLADREKALKSMEFELRLKELFNSPPSLLEILRECRTLVREEPAIQSQVRIHLKNWLEGQIIELKHRIEEPVGVKIQEAWLKGKPTRKLGVFVKSAQADGTIIYKFWKLEDWKGDEKAGNFTTYNAAFLEAEPHRPIEARTVETMNELRNELLRTFNSENSWTSYRDTAIKLQNELNSHYARLETGPTEKISLEAAIKVADVVLNDWTSFNEIFGNK